MKVPPDCIQVLVQGKAVRVGSAGGVRRGFLAHRKSAAARNVLVKTANEPSNKTRKACGR
jgi:hypothetical protein